MSEAKHTPGPWFIEGMDMDIKSPSDHPGFRLAQVHGGRPWWEREANARLIAAAPELLATLQELIDIEGPQPGSAAWADKARALIAKATGAAT